MSGIVLTLPILNGKAEAWRRFCQELSGVRKLEHETSRLQQGIRRERLALIENQYGSTAVATFEADDLSLALAHMLTSQRPFDRWYLDQIKALHGINLNEYKDSTQRLPSQEHQHIHFDWGKPEQHDNGSSRPLSYTK